jgi:glycosyltransferase involved in cell wall biosynthesis
MKQTLPSFGAASGVVPVRISVVIPHLNQPALLDRCLRSLHNGVRLPDEIIVVDNGSTTGPEAVCGGYPHVRLFVEPEPGPGPARNKGIAESSGDILAFIDADCLADPDWLVEAERAMSDLDAQILGGDVRISYDDPSRLTMLEAYESIFAYRMDRYIAREGFTGTGNLVVRRSAILDVGPFAGLSIAEDRDWGQRATRMGYRIRYVAAMKVYHPARQTFFEMWKKWDRHSAHDYVAARQQPAGRLRFLAKTCAMALSPLAEIPKIIASDRLSGVRSRVLAFVGLARVRLYRTGVMVRLLAGSASADLSGAWNRK